MNRHWMPLYIGDFLADTTQLNCEQTGAYLALIMYAWMHGGKIADDDHLMARIVKCHPPHWPRLRKALEAYFDCIKTPGHWTSKRVTLELNKADEISNKRKAAAQQMLSKRRANAHANAEQVHQQTGGYPQSQSQRKKEPDAVARSNGSDGAGSPTVELPMLSYRDEQRLLEAYRRQRKTEEQEKHQ